MSFKTPIRSVLFISLLISLWLTACIEIVDMSENSNDTTTTNDNTSNDTGTNGGSADWYQLYFTPTTCPPEEDRTGGIDEIIGADMERAEESVDIAAYDFDAPPMINALVDLNDRGVVVRVVTDTDNADQASIEKLRDNGITVIEDERSALMHNKFVIIDHRYVWMGAMNFTTNDVYCNNNNTIRIDSTELAENYTTEFNEMFEEQKFGPRSPDNTPHENLTVGGVELENYFASEKKLLPLIASEVETAQSEILFMAFSFTGEEVGEAMLAKANDGVTVRGVFENTGSNTQYSYFPPMKEAGLDVRQDGNPRNMHHKVIIIDRQMVIFGSFNFTDSANDSNDENVLIVHDPTIANLFVQEFERVYAEGKEE